MASNEIHVTISTELNIYNMEGDLVKSIQYKHCKEPNVSSSLPIGNNEYIIADNNKGLYHINNNGHVVAKLCDGSFCDVYEYKEKYYAFKYKTANVHLFYSNNQCITKLTKIKLKDFTNGHWLDRVVVSDACIFTSSWYNNCVYKYTLTGQLLDEYGQYGSKQRGTTSGLFYRPFLCDIDPSGSLLVADYCNDRLQVCSSAGQWVVISLPHEVSDPRDVIVNTQDQSLWVLAYDGLYQLN
jgi:hypothetical protein